MQSVCLRLALESDEALLMRIYGSTRESELALVSWTPEQKENFVRHQFTAQSTYYKAEYPGALFQVIEFEDRPVGRLYLHYRTREIHILDIALLPEARNKGIGSYLLKRIMMEGAEKQKPVTIFVEVFNPAKRLYERLGFRKKPSSSPVYELMEWAPDAVQPG